MVQHVLGLFLKSRTPRKRNSFINNSVRIEYNKLNVKIIFNHRKPKKTRNSTKSHCVYCRTPVRILSKNSNIMLPNERATYETQKLATDLG